MKRKSKLLGLTFLIFFISISFSSANNIQLMLNDNKQEATENKQRNKKIQTELKNLKQQKKVVEKKLRTYQHDKKKHEKQLIKEEKEFKRQKTNLSEITQEYILLVNNLAEESTNQEQDIIQTLLQSQDSADAVIIYQIGEALISQQNQLLQEIRQQTIKVYQSQQKTSKQKQQLEELVYLEKNGLQANRLAQSSLKREKQFNTDTIKFLAQERKQLIALQDENEFDSVVTGRAQQDPLLTPGQWVFSHRVSALTGLDVNVIKAWVLAEMSSHHAQQREEENNHNWLNIGYYDKLAGGGAFQGYSVWDNPVSAAKASAALLENKFLAISEPIQKIILSRDKTPSRQLEAIYTSDWASSHYHNGESLKGTYRLVTKEESPSPAQTNFKSPKDNKVYRIGIR